MTVDLSRKLRVGVLVNPIAGLGGRAGLKGSDDPLRLAPLLDGVEWNDEVYAFARGVSCIRKLDRNRVVLATAAGPLGEDVVKRATMFGGPVFEVVRLPGPPRRFGSTTADDTRIAAQRLAAANVDLVLFVGGDGTAVDVARALGSGIAIVGVPAGVKMFSPVFAETPEVAAALINRLAIGFASRPADVLDLDERSYREGTWLVRSQAVALVPEDEAIQAGKAGAVPTDAEAAQDLVAWFRGYERPGTSYVLGSGTTVGALKTALAGGSPLGVDLWRDGRFVVVDGDETGLLAALGDDGEAEIIVSPTGGQGAVLGRGTAQISPGVIERVGVEHLTVVATPAKLLGLRALFVDTGDAEVDAAFPDFIKVRTDPFTEKVFPLHRGVSIAR